MEHYFTWVAGSLFLVVAWLLYWAATQTTLLKDDSAAPIAPYSLSRTQLFWWTAVITLCLIARYGLTGDFTALNQTCLVLLGISLGTTGLGKVIDNSDEASDAQANAAGVIPSAPPRHQDQNSESFFRDILSDEKGPSTHRLQIVVFNLVYGVLFVSKFLSSPEHALPEFGDMELAILGISASGYLYLKNTENG